MSAARLCTSYAQRVGPLPIQLVNVKMLPTASRRLVGSSPDDGVATQATQRPTPGNDPRMGTQDSSNSSNIGPDVKVVKLEDADVEGVAKVDKDEWVSDSGKVRTLVAGDAAAILLFAVIGRINHGGILDVDLALTALPFWISWYSVASVTGAYGREAQDGYVGPAALCAAKTWAIATPLGLVLRSLLKGYAPPTPFIIVSMVSTGVLMVGWRSIIASITTPEDQLTPLERFRKQKQRKGTAGEFMGLLMSLTKRW